MNRQIRNKNMESDLKSKMVLIDKIYKDEEKHIIKAFNSGKDSYHYNAVGNIFYNSNDKFGDNEKLEGYILQKCNSWRDKFGDNVKHTCTYSSMSNYDRDIECHINFAKLNTDPKSSTFLSTIMHDDDDDVDE
jgi:hypothetical protein